MKEDNFSAENTSSCSNGSLLPLSSYTEALEHPSKLAALMLSRGSGIVKSSNSMLNKRRELLLQANLSTILEKGVFSALSNVSSHRDEEGSAVSLDNSQSHCIGGGGGGGRKLRGEGENYDSSASLESQSHPFRSPSHPSQFYSVAASPVMHTSLAPSNLFNNSSSFSHYPPASSPPSKQHATTTATIPPTQISHPPPFLSAGISPSEEVTHNANESTAPLKRRLLGSPMRQGGIGTTSASSLQTSLNFALFCKLMYDISINQLPIQDKRIRIILLIFQWLSKNTEEKTSPYEFFTGDQFELLVNQARAYMHLLHLREPLTEELLISCRLKPSFGFRPALIEDEKATEKAANDSEKQVDGKLLTRIGYQRDASGGSRSVGKSVREDVMGELQSSTRTHSSDASECAGGSVASVGGAHSYSRTVAGEAGEVGASEKVETVSVPSGSALKASSADMRDISGSGIGGSVSSMPTTTNSTSTLTPSQPISHNVLDLRAESIASSSRPPPSFSSDQNAGSSSVTHGSYSPDSSKHPFTTVAHTDLHKGIMRQPVEQLRSAHEEAVGRNLSLSSDHPEVSSTAHLESKLLAAQRLLLPFQGNNQVSYQYKVPLSLYGPPIVKREPDNWLEFWNRLRMLNLEKAKEELLLAIEKQSLEGREHSPSESSDAHTHKKVVSSLEDEDGSRVIQPSFPPPCVGAEKAKLLEGGEERVPPRPGEGERIVFSNHSLVGGPSLAGSSHTHTLYSAQWDGANGILKEGLADGRFDASSIVKNDDFGSSSKFSESATSSLSSSTSTSASSTSSFPSSMHGTGREATQVYAASPSSQEEITYQKHLSLSPPSSHLKTAGNEGIRYSEDSQHSVVQNSHDEAAASVFDAALTSNARNTAASSNNVSYVSTFASLPPNLRSGSLQKSFEDGILGDYITHTQQLSSNGSLQRSFEDGILGDHTTQTQNLSSNEDSRLPRKRVCRGRVNFLGKAKEVGAATKFEGVWRTGGGQLRQDDLQGGYNMSAVAASRIRSLGLKSRLKLLGLVDFQRLIREQVSVSRFMEKDPTVLPPLQYIGLKAARRSKALRASREEGEKFVEERINMIQGRRAFINEVLDHSRRYFAFHKENYKEIKKLAAAMMRHFTSIQKKEEHTEALLQKERLDALKANNEVMYLSMLQETKNKRLLTLIEQTEESMKKIGNFVIEQREKDNAQFGWTGSSVSPEAKATADAEDSSLHSLIRSKERYYRLTHAITENITHLPACLKGGNLRSYQMKGLNWLVSLYNNGLNGILADAMGLGKTVQTVALLAYLYEVKGVRGPHLIVAPLSTLRGNWEHEFNRWLPGMVKCVYEGPKEWRRSLRNKWFPQQNNEPQFHVMFTSDSFIIRDKVYLRKFDWEYLIVDEAHRLKNPNSKLVKTLNQGFNVKHRIALTGTPLQNDLQEVWALLNFLMPKVFSSSQTFDEWFNAPLASCRKSKDEGEHTLSMTEEEKLLIIDRLHKVLRPFLLRREKEEVADEVPPKQEQVLWCPLSGVQQKLYEMIQANPAGQNRMVQLRKVCNHPYLFCGREIPADESIIRACGKFVMLDNILPKLKAAGHRVLVFSQMTRLLDLLEVYLHLRSMTFLRLDGNTPGDIRQKNLQLFNNNSSDYFCFILSTKAGGLGINLQSADTVIIFDSDWNPQNDEQAQSRAHRIGQKKEVLTIRFITPDSIEETILQAAGIKLDQDALVIKSGMYHGHVYDMENERKEQVREILRRQQQQEVVKKAYDGDLVNRLLARTTEDLEIFEQLDKKRKLLHLPGLLTEEHLPPCLFKWVRSASKAGERIIEDTKQAEELWKQSYTEADQFVVKPTKSKKIQSDQGPSWFSLSLEEQESRKKMINLCVTETLTEALNKSEFADFHELPDKVELRDYYEQIKKPISLKGIRKFSSSFQFTSLHKVEKYLSRLADNARAFNGSDSFIYFRALQCIGWVMYECRKKMCVAFHRFHSAAEAEKLRKGLDSDYTSKRAEELDEVDDEDAEEEDDDGGSLVSSSAYGGASSRAHQRRVGNSNGSSIYHAHLRSVSAIENSKKPQRYGAALMNEDDASSDVIENTQKHHNLAVTSGNSLENDETNGSLRVSSRGGARIPEKLEESSWSLREDRRGFPRQSSGVSFVEPQAHTRNAPFELNEPSSTNGVQYPEKSYQNPLHFDRLAEDGAESLPSYHTQTAGSTILQAADSSFDAAQSSYPLNSRFSHAVPIVSSMNEGMHIPSVPSMINSAQTQQFMTASHSSNASGQLNSQPSLDPNKSPPSSSFSLPHHPSSLQHLPSPQLDTKSPAVWRPGGFVKLKSSRMLQVAGEAEESRIHHSVNFNSMEQASSLQGESGKFDPPMGVPTPHFPPVKEGGYATKRKKKLKTGKKSKSRHSKGHYGNVVGHSSRSQNQVHPEHGSLGLDGKNESMSYQLPSGSYSNSGKSSSNYSGISSPVSGSPQTVLSSAGRNIPPQQYHNQQQYTGYHFDPQLHDQRRHAGSIGSNITIARDASWQQVARAEAEKEGRGEGTVKLSVPSFIAEDGRKNSFSSGSTNKGVGDIGGSFYSGHFERTTYPVKHHNLRYQDLSAASYENDFHDDLSSEVDEGVAASNEGQGFSLPVASHMMHTASSGNNRTSIQPSAGSKSFAGMEKEGIGIASPEEFRISYNPGVGGVSDQVPVKSSGIADKGKGGFRFRIRLGGDPGRKSSGGSGSSSSSGNTDQ